MAKTPEFKYAPMFQLGKDTTEYRLLTKEGVSTAEFEGKTILKVSKEALTLLAQQAFHDVEFMLRREHNEQVAKILTDPEASENDKYVALQFLRNDQSNKTIKSRRITHGNRYLRRTIIQCAWGASRTKGCNTSAQTDSPWKSAHRCSAH